MMKSRLFMLERVSRSMRPHGRRRASVIVVLVALTVTPVACSASTSTSDGKPADTTVAAAVTTTTAAPAGSASTARSTTTDHAGDDNEPITSEDICEAVTTDAVAKATGLQINGLEPSQGSTPQCSYEYPSENGPDSSFTIAASRYTDDDAQTIEEAFDGALRINITTAGGAAAKKTEVDAGDQAVIVSGPSLEVGQLRVGNVLASVILPPDVVSPEQYADLLVAVADAFA